MKLYNLKSAFGYVADLYGISISESAFETLALNAWELIGNKHTRLHRYIGAVEDKQLELPCNVELIESVHIPINDVQITSSDSTYINSNNIYVESYIDSIRGFDDMFYQKGKLVDYKESNNVLYFSKNYSKVMVIYHGIEVDEEGLPLINDKEMRAIAAYVAYATLYREGLMKKDGGIIQLAQTINAEWLKLCNAARIPTHLSQNEIDSILDVKVRYDRKSYGKSFKPIM